MINLSKIIIILLFTAQVSATGNKFPGGGRSQINDDLDHFIGIGKTLVTPSNYNKSVLLQMGQTAGLTMLIFAVDARMQEFVHSNSNRTNDRIFNFDEYHGSVYTQFFALGLYGAGAASQNSKLQRLGLKAIEATVYSSFITAGLKALFGRLRPFKTTDPFEFKPLSMKSSYTALPSGHTTSAFAVSTIMAKSVDNIWWDCAWYGAAVGVAASRIYHDRHWASDTFLGAVIGYQVAKMIHNSDSGSNLRSNTLNNYKFNIFRTKTGIGYSLSFSFPINGLPESNR